MHCGWAANCLPATSMPTSTSSVTPSASTLRSVVFVFGDVRAGQGAVVVVGFSDHADDLPGPGLESPPGMMPGRNPLFVGQAFPAAGCGGKHPNGAAKSTCRGEAAVPSGESEQDFAHCNPAGTRGSQVRLAQNPNETSLAQGERGGLAENPLATVVGESPVSALHALVAPCHIIVRRRKTVKQAIGSIGLGWSDAGLLGGGEFVGFSALFAATSSLDACAEKTSSGPLADPTPELHPHSGSAKANAAAAVRKTRVKPGLLALQSTAFLTVFGRYGLSRFWLRKSWTEWRLFGAGVEAAAVV